MTFLAVLVQWGDLWFPFGGKPSVQLVIVYANPGNPAINGRLTATFELRLQLAIKLGFRMRVPAREYQRLINSLLPGIDWRE